MFNIILIGPQGSGKGTQAKMMSSELGIPHISTGDLLRAEISANTETGIEANKYVAKGNLVPDDLILKILKARLSKADCKKGFILDGYPRNLSQADRLDKMLEEVKKEIDYVIVIDVPRDVSIKRIEGRFACKKCGTMYNKYFSNTKIGGVCDVCGSTEFSHREDDSDIDAINKRLDIYEKVTTPLIEYYGKKGLIYSVDGVKNVESVGSEITKVLEIN